jgi:DNA excision repair protein ERCC-2
MELFPYTPRKNQTAIMETITNVISTRGTLVYESGTGSGKTICTLASTLQYAREHGKKIIYATRTNAQQRQVILELRAIRDHLTEGKESIFGVGIQGRANMCLLARNNPELAKGNSDELSRFCAHEKKKVRATDNAKGKGCHYYRAFLEKKELIDETTTWMKTTLPTAEEFIEYCQRKQICPYELNKLFIKETSLVIVPYIYVFNLTIRNMLLDWLSVAEEDMILVIDEAHNLPDYIRDLFSTQLSIWMLNSCVVEAEKFGDPSILQKTTISDFCRLLIDILRDLRDTYVYGILEEGIRKGPVSQTDAFLPAHEFETEILSRLGITSKTLFDIISDLIAYGEKVQEYRQKEGKLPRSFLYSLGSFLDFWMNLEMNQYAKLVVDDAAGKNPRIEAFCLDPSVGTGVIHAFYSSIHMSGTLEPLEEYRDSIGLPQTTELISFPSPFSMGNRRIFFTSDVTTKYSELAHDDTMLPRISDYVTQICNTFPKNTMVFFPSFNILSMFKRQGGLNAIDRCMYVEEQAMSQTALMDLVAEFKECGGKETEAAALLSVMGGRISEGMDFPAEELEIVILVGIPYPKPSARQRGLQRFYDLKFRKGWEYTVEAPTARKLLQSIGRLIRKENDRGVAVILDRRAPRFKKYIRDLQQSPNLLQDINSFLAISHHS